MTEGPTVPAGPTESLSAGAATEQPTPAGSPGDRGRQHPTDQHSTRSNPAEPDPTEPDPAEAALTPVVAFYSYSGGTGRTMALANVAWMLASAGKSVLVVDWNLGTPGLHYYFRPFLIDKYLTDRPGVINILCDFVQDADRLLDQAREDSPEAQSRMAALRARRADCQEAVEALQWDFPDGGRIHMIGPGRQDGEPDPHEPAPRAGDEAVDERPARDSGYDTRVNTFPWDEFYVEDNGKAFIAELRAWLRGQGYDYVLVDSPAGTSTVSSICTSGLATVVVTAFTMSNQSIEGAARTARTMLREGVDRIIPVPMRVVNTDVERADRRQDLVARVFRKVLAANTGSDDPRIHRGRLVHLSVPESDPYHYDEVLAPFVHPQRDRFGLSIAYRTLAAEIAGTSLDDVRDLDPDERDRWRERFERSGIAPPRKVLLFGAPSDRAWTDWVEAVLTAVGVQVHRPWGDAGAPRSLPIVDRVVVVTSPALGDATPGWPNLRDYLRPTGRTLVPPPVTSVIVRTRPEAGEMVVEPLDRRPVRLVGLGDEAQARAELLARFELSDVPSVSLGMVRLARYPGRPWPERSNLSRRDLSFTGREAALEAMRDRLIPNGQDRMLYALLGPFGSGTSSIAREYAHRFRADYDLIWWIPATSAASVRASLGELAHRLRPEISSFDGQRSRGEPFEQVALNALRSAEDGGRWLLVYDGACAPAELTDLLPPTTDCGHVIITSVEPGWREYAEIWQVEPWSRVETRRYLQKRLPGTALPVLDGLSARVGNLPLELHTAVEAVRRQRGRHTRFDEDVAAYLGATTEAEPWRREYDLLRSGDGRQRAAARLLELCCFLAPDGIGDALTTSPVLLEELARFAGDPDLAGVGPSAFPRILVERGLAQERDDPYLLVISGSHRGALRQGMSDDECSDTQAAALRVLAEVGLAAASLPGGAGRRLSAEVSRHIDESGAALSTAPRVRRWLAYHAYYMWQTCEWADGHRLAHMCLDRWRQDPDIGPDDVLTLRMASRKANFLRSLGQFAEAFTLDDDTLGSQRRILGRTDEDTLITASCLAADLRALGMYRQAWVEDRATLEAFRAARGAQHQGTFAAWSNLGLSMFLAGLVPDALAEDRAVHEAREAVFGAQDRGSLLSRSRIGVDLCALGRPDEALAYLREAATGLARADGDRGYRTLFAYKDLAVAYRRRGEHGDAVRLDRRTHERFRDTYGYRDVGTLACQLSLAADLYARRRLDPSEPDAGPAAVRQAIEYARAGLDGYVDLYGDDHPVTHACRANLALYLREVDPAMARELAARAHDGLLTLGEHHPHRLAALIILALCAAAGDDVAAAHDFARAALADCREFLIEDHPYITVLDRCAGPDAFDPNPLLEFEYGLDLDISRF